MMMKLKRAIGAFTLLLLPLLPASAAVEEGPAGVEGLRPGESAREADAVFPGAEPLGDGGAPTHLVFRVIDADTRAPLPGARLSAYLEKEPVLEPAWPPIADAPADEGGWVRLELSTLPAEAESPWFAVEADGFAPVWFMGGPDEEVVALRRGVDLPILVLDPSNRPVPGCRVALLLGCGHVPDARSAVTDANGRAVLPCVAPGVGDLWPVAPGFESQYAWPSPWEEGDPPVVIRLRPGADLVGRVLDPGGRAVARAAVGAPHCHRGPWTTTGPDGRFRLIGAEAGSDLTIVTPGDGRALSVGSAPAGVSRVVRIPAAGTDETSPVNEDEKRAPLSLRLLVADGSPFALAAGVVATRLADGFTRRIEVESKMRGLAVIDLPPGRYRVSATGVYSETGTASAEVEIADGGGGGDGGDGKTRPEPLALVVPTYPSIDVTLAESPTDLFVHLVTGTRARDVTAAVLAREPIPVPPTGPAAFRLDCGARSRIVPLPAERPGKLVLEPPPATRVRARLVGPDGKPRRARVAVADDDDLTHARGDLVSEVDVPTRLVGRAFLVGAPEDESLRPFAVPVRLPAEEGAVVDAGTVLVAPRAPRLSVLSAGGEPCAGADAILSRPGVAVHATLDESGEWTGSVDPAPGDLVEVSSDSESRLPLRATLSGAPPFVLRWPAGVLDVAVRDRNGDQPVAEFSVIVDGARFEGRDGAARIEGVAPGPHEVVVAARGRRARVLDVVVLEGEKRAIVARLGPED